MPARIRTPILLLIVLLFQLSFLYIYFSELLPEINEPLATLYWISAGLLGLVTGLYVLFKQKWGDMARLIAFIVLTIGFGLLALLLLALGVTSM